MKTQKHPPSRSSTRILVFAILILALAIAPAGAADKQPAPQGRTYFTVITGVGDSPYEVQASCLRFNAAQMCIVDGDCFQFSRTDGGVQTRSQTSFEIHGLVSDPDDAVQIELVGQGRADSRGRRSSVAAVAQIRAEDPVSGQMRAINVAFSGRETGTSKCQQLVDEFEAAMSTLQN